MLVEIMCERGRWGRIWVPSVPAALYATWRLRWGGGLFGGVGTAGNSPGGVIDVIGHGVQAATGAVAGLGVVQLTSPTLRAHLPWVFGVAQVTVVIGALVLAALLIHRAQIVRRQPVSPRLVNLLTNGLLLWLLLAIGRGSLGDLYASRYVYQGAIVAALIIVEVCAFREWSRRAHRLMTVAVLASVALNIGWMVVWGNHLRQESSVARAQLGALDIAQAEAPPFFRPSREFALADVTAANYVEAVRRFGGSPAYTTTELAHAPEQSREAADDVLARAVGMSIAPGRAPMGGPPPLVGSSAGARTVSHASWLIFAPEQPVASADIAPRSAHGLVLEIQAGGGLLIQARRYASRYTIGVGGLRGGTGPAALSAALWEVPQPWHFRMFLTSPTRICSGRYQPASSVEGAV